MDRKVLVYGAYGHTGRFVVAELLRRGFLPVLSGRNQAALEALSGRFPGSEIRPATIDDEASLRDAVGGVSVVVNCAGPFLDTAISVATAAVGAGVHYLDVAAEQAAVQGVYRAHEDLGWPADVAVIPAMAFYGGLADLLASAVMGDWDTVDRISVAVGLDRWWPTQGTRITGRRNTAARLVVDHGRLIPAPAPPPVLHWDFPGAIGPQTVVGTPFTEIITMTRHLNASQIDTYLTTNALEDILDPATPAPRAVDDSGRSAQQFVVDVVLRRGEQQRRISAEGRDIYAVTAPLVVEAVQRLSDGRTQISGAAAPGEVFDPADFLGALSPRHLTIRPH
ncbi:saccharopine dehydrogenase family protein [Phytoactinopolyspora mesophila]|uniref:NAD(P)H-binding protein n=1 Tax=Phytoactinopolyspora mesophila TaxID=2650750 RepID=A0A7K3MDU8_9ACTN|nr:saccharopine dehydrogenase NADP-binding domain-containing protein [Phytoactinopolyspora mesophila]NDL60588.1 NAD(P)H-binding protein [Phytoactinopolyspora mesophila]